MHVILLLFFFSQTRPDTSGAFSLAEALRGMDVSKLIVIWPNNVDSTRTIKKGRRIPKASGCESWALTDSSILDGRRGVLLCTTFFFVFKTSLAMRFTVRRREQRSVTPLVCGRVLRYNTTKGPLLRRSHWHARPSLPLEDDLHSYRSCSVSGLPPGLFLFVLHELRFSPQVAHRSSVLLHYLYID